MKISLVFGIFSMCAVYSAALAQDGINYGSISASCPSFRSLEASTKRSVAKFRRMNERKMLRSQIVLYNSLSRNLTGKQGCKTIARFFATEAQIAKEDLRKYTASSFSLSDSTNARIARIQRNAQLAEAMLVAVAQGAQRQQANSRDVMQGLGTFTVSDTNLRICVWDHECEDGDRVSVQLSNGRRHSVELRNAQFCMKAVVPKNSTTVITLTALNGTGHKGNCSHQNVNTGAISVSGGGGTQIWSMRGGAGTSGQIVHKP